MANQFATNFALTSSSNSFNALWKLTRAMKAAGWTYRASGSGTTKDTTGLAANDLWGTSGTPLTDTYTSVGTYVLPASNAVTLPTGTINVNSTTSFAGNGNIVIATSQGWQTIAYTGTTTTTFTGCTGGTGTIYTGSQVGFNAMSMDSNATGGTAAGNAACAWLTMAGPLTVKVPLSALPTGTPIRGEIVTQATSGATGELFGFVWDTVGLSGWASIGPQHTPQNTTIAAASIGVSLPTGTINVASTTGFGSTGYLNVWTSQVSTTIAAGSNGASLPQATINVASTTNFPAVTTIASGSNGASTNIGTLNVISTTGFPATGTLAVTSTAGTILVPYTGTSGGTSFTGCTGTSGGTWSTGNPVNGIGTIYVQSSAGVQTITYTGFTGTTFTGCTGGTGTLSTGGFVAGPQQLQQVAYTGTSGGNQFTGCTLGTGIMMTGNAVTGYSATFDNTHTITGSLSTATMTPTGTVTYYQREVSFGKPPAGNTTTNGSDSGNIFYVAADGYVENNQLFSTLAASVGCTANLWPGSGGTSNTFSIASTVTSNPMQICVRGTGGSVGTIVTSTSATWFGTAGGVWGTSAQIAVANAIPATSTTADGSFYTAITTTTVNMMGGIIFTRLDDTEPGDLDPYAWASTSSNNTVSSYSRTTWTGFFNSSPGALFASGSPGAGSALFSSSSPANMPWIGYQARGCTVVARDIPFGWITTLAWSLQPQNTAGFTQDQGVATIRLVSHPASTPPLVREPPLLYSPGLGGSTKQLKGRPRWVMFFSLGNTLDTFDSKSWIAVMPLSPASTNNNPCMALGPYDGVTTPTT